MSVSKKELIGVLEEIALLLELKGENPFKIRAYSNGARALNSLDEDIEALIRSGEIKKQKGFGDALVQKLGEYVETGKLGYLEKLRSEFPETLPELLIVPGLGPKKVKLFYDELHVTSLELLEKAS